MAVFAFVVIGRILRLHDLGCGLFLFPSIENRSEIVAAGVD
jgi:hypothetical protein